MPPGRPSDPRLSRLAPSRRACWVPAALALTLLGACGEPPSYHMSWRFAENTLPGVEPPPAPALTEITQCANIGVGDVRVTTVPKGALICDPASVVAVREYPCLPREGLPVAGPTLEPGDYTVRIQGLRRSGEPWACPADDLDVERDEEGNIIPDERGDPIPTCLDAPDPCVARQIVEISVGEEGEITAAEPASENGADAFDFDAQAGTISVALRAPPECDDGIDNDRDGQVDGADPACYEGALGTAEDADSGVAYFDIQVLFLGTPVVELNNVEIRHLRIEIDGELFAKLGESQLELRGGYFHAPLLAQVDEDLHPPDEAPAESHTHLFTLTAIGYDQDLQEEVARTQAFEVEFPMEPDEASYVSESFEFGSEHFLEPLSYPTRFIQNLLLTPDATDGPACELNGFAGVEIEQLRARIRNQDGVALTAAELGLPGTDDGDGWVAFPCPAATVATGPLLWGSYTLELDAQIGGVTCFATDGEAPLAPEPSSDAQSFFLERILTDGAPPPACAECTQDTHCYPGSCEQGLCVDPS